MIIWRGLGWVVFAMVVGLGAITQWAVETHLGVAYAGWPLSAVLAVTGAVAGAVGLAHNPRGAPARHSFFFVPLQYWAPIAWVAAVANLTRSFG
jgi:hypothetical protein